MNNLPEQRAGREREIQQQMQGGGKCMAGFGTFGRAAALMSLPAGDAGRRLPTTLRQAGAPGTARETR